MNIAEAVRKTLIDDSGVAGLVQSRIYPDVALEATDYPCIVYYPPDSAPDEASFTMEGPGLIRTQLSLSFLGRTWGESKAVADAVYSALGPFQSQVSLQGVPIDSLFMGNLQDIGRDPDSAKYRFDQTIEILTK